MTEKLLRYRANGLRTQEDVCVAAITVFWVSQRPYLMAEDDIKAAYDDVMEMLRTHLDEDLISPEVERALDYIERYKGTVSSMIELLPIFGCFENISAYEYVGFHFDPYLKREYQAAVLRELRAAPKYYRETVMFLAGPWNVDLWWIREVLTDKTIKKLEAEKAAIAA